MSAKLSSSITAFAADLRSFVQRASDSITALKRTAEQRPQAGVQDFKECLDDLEQQVADFSDEVQQLAQYTSESVSFEELIGHCSAVYRVNRATALALEQHLSQYGYQQPVDAVLEPEGVQECMQEDDEMLLAEEFTAFTARTRQACSTPTSPVSKGSMSMLRSNAAAGHIPSRLGRSQPGSPTSAYTVTGIGFGAADTSQLRDCAPHSTMRSLVGAQGSAGAPRTQLRQQQQQSRVSLGSNTSSTPAGLMISPGVAALASKYATSSVGGSSVGGLSLQEQPSAGGPATSDRSMMSPCRDLNLAYALSDTNSPDLPIFGRASTTPLTAVPTARGGQQQRQHVLETPPVQRQGRGCDADSTGELYSSLIHSNMQGMSRRGAEANTPELEVTPPCTRGGVSPCGSPHAPATAGRLPPTWVSEKLQQLENLQADVTLTLSQMKRNPSRSRTSTPAPGSELDSDDDTQPGPLAQQRQVLEQQQQGTRQHGAACQQQESRAHASAAPPPAAAPAAAMTQGGRRAPPQPQQTQQQEAAAAASAAKPAAAARQHRSARAGPGPDSLTAAAAAASADLENLMASLSIKYALGADMPETGEGSSGGDGGSGHDEDDESAGMGVDSQFSSPSSPAPHSTLAASFAKQYADGTGDHHHQQEEQHQQQQQFQGVGGSTLLTPATQQTIRRVVALGGTAVRPQSSIRRVQPTTDVHRLEEIRGFYHQQTGMVPQQLDARLASAEPAEAAAASQTAAAGEAAGLHQSNSCSSCHGSHAHKPEAETEPEHAVLRPVQIQDTTAAGADTSVNAAAGLRQSRQRQQQQQQQQQEKPKQQPSAQQQPAEALTPRAARLQRRLQQQQQSSQQSQQQDAENTCPASISTAKQAAAGPVGAAAVGCGAVKLQCISADEFGQLPSWCRSLLSVEVLNGVLQELSAIIASRCNAGGEVDALTVEGFTAEDVALLGHAGSSSKTIVSCLHKLGRASLQRSSTGGNVYKLTSSGQHCC